jgi:16S rRNA A1518/A1519 N6-dimethyltransferase RsmA/KsgA/DIM1 with predicted DNA glycosylase/AP lyase activity
MPRERGLIELARGVGEGILSRVRRNILEIGPGAGRWTEYRLSRGAQVTIVDVTQKCIDLCRLR